jgi:hypothetical protein
VIYRIHYDRIFSGSRLSAVTLSAVTVITKLNISTLNIAVMVNNLKLTSTRLIQYWTLDQFHGFRRHCTNFTSLGQVVINRVNLKGRHITIKEDSSMIFNCLRNVKWHITQDTVAYWRLETVGQRRFAHSHDDQLNLSQRISPANHVRCDTTTNFIAINCHTNVGQG